MRNVQPMRKEILFVRCLNFFFLSFYVIFGLYYILRKATGSYRTYSIPDKTVTLVPEFAVEDLPLAELQPTFLRLQ